MRDSIDEGPFERFHDRLDAGQRLADRLRRYRHRQRTVTLGIARGGVVPAAEVARTLGLPLDVLISRKIGSPGNPDLAIGAVAESAEPYLSEDSVEMTGASADFLAAAVERERLEIARRQDVFRGGRTLSLPDRSTVILIDDGVATGATILAGIHALRSWKVARIVVAIPVAPPDTVELLRSTVDDLVVLWTPMLFWSIRAFYDEFPTVSDDEVGELLSQAESEGRRPSRLEPRRARG